MPKRTEKEKPLGLSIDEVLRKVDPTQAAVMVLGGTAAACGIVPPMTKLFQALNGETGTMFGGFDIFITPLLVRDLLNSLANPGQPADLTQTQEGIKMLGLFCSGAIEAAIMYQFVQDPAVKKAILDLPGQAIQGVGKIIP